MLARARASQGWSPSLELTVEHASHLAICDSSDLIKSKVKNPGEAGNEAQLVKHLPITQETLGSAPAPSRPDGIPVLRG